MMGQRAPNRLEQFDPNLPAGELSFDHVIFLDFDGVLHPEGCGPDMEFCFSLNFSELIMELDPNGMLPIVVSSDWRFSETIEQLRGHFHTQIQRQFVGVTPDLTPKPTTGWPSPGGRENGRRQREIEHWMAQHAPAGKWLAIDDRESGFAEDCSSLFLVPGVYEDNGGGISSYQAHELKDRLKKFLAEPQCAPVHKR